MKKTFHNKPFQWRKRCFGKKPAPPFPALFFLAALMALAAFSGCDLLNNKPEIDLEKALDDEIAWANAPFVPVRVEEGGLGTASPRGALDTAVKQGYFFSVNYVPKTEYPFRGWQAKLEGSAEFLASWTAEEETGQDQVKFVSLNESGTEAEIFVYVKPAQRIIIGPLGLDAPELAVRVDEGGTGTASPRGSVSGIRLGFPFMVSFLPNAAYEFKGWQVRQEGKTDLLGSWSAGMESVEGEYLTLAPKTPAGTEMELTITKDPGAGTIIVEPLNGDNPFLTVELSGGGLGTISPMGAVTTVKQGFAFTVSFLSDPAYGFNGWQARYEGEPGLAASWTGGGASGTDTVMFTPKNIMGTEVQVTILKNPVTPEGTPKKIIISPLGADSATLNVEVSAGGMGTASPQGPVSGVRLGFPFSLSYQPGGAYPFGGWQAKVEGSSAPLATWTVNSETGEEKVKFAPQNVTGTEVRITILANPGGKLVIGPLGADYPEATVRVNYPGDWGRSPQFGEISPKPRKGIPFGVSFSPIEAYEFIRWRAAKTADYNNGNPTVFLADSEVAITEGTDGAASVTLNIVGDITLIPWCRDRPRITQANPPLINTGISYTRNQPIRLWFAAGLDRATVKFGAGFIEISAQNIGGTGGAYDDPDTPVNENGDLTGSRRTGTAQFFKAPEYDEQEKTVTIRPGNNDGDKPPPGDVLITVTVGAGVKGSNGSEMVKAVSFYYRTSTLETQNVYTAENIWAIHNPTDSPGAEKFFYTGAETSRDRRLWKNTSGNYEVTLYFTVQASNPAEMTYPPNKITVAELAYANLAGGDLGAVSAVETVFDVEDAETGTGTAGAIYRQNNSGGTFYYKIRYEWTTTPQPGIIRLIVLPGRDQNGDGNYAGAGDIAPDSWGNAHAEGRFAAVVLDDQPPSGSPVLSLSGQASVSGGVYNYSNTVEHKNLKIEMNPGSVADNGGFGIHQTAATQDRPWTMDDPAALKWQWRVVTAGTQNWPANNDAWHPFSDTTQTLDLSTVTGLDANTRRDVQVRFRDSLGNINTADEGWIAMGTIVYYTPTYSP
ncbi:MAG: class II glutamine amidotransferase, partial [Tannerella sp.]|nr:class II glutamine amidotransferase [Tannerella sp.]